MSRSWRHTQMTQKSKRQTNTKKSSGTHKRIRGTHRSYLERQTPKNNQVHTKEQEAHTEVIWRGRHVSFVEESWNKSRFSCCSWNVERVMVWVMRVMKWVTSHVICRMSHGISHVSPLVRGKRVTVWVALHIRGICHEMSHVTRHS